MTDITIHIANPSEYADRCLFVFQFGAYGATHVAVFHGCDDLAHALETATEWLAENEPGHLSTEQEVRDCFDADELATMDEEEGGYWDCHYTESGYLASYEWAFTTPEGAEAMALRERGKLESAEPQWVTMSCCLNLPDADDQEDYVKAQLLDIVNATPADELCNLLVDTIGPIRQESYKEQLRADLTRRIGYHDGLCMDDERDVRLLVDVVFLALFD